MPFDAPKCDECKQLPVQFICSKCDESYCQDCDEKLHNRSQKRKEHKRHPFTGVEKVVNRFCSIKGHEEVSISLLCLSCKKLFCSNCLLKEHKLHETVTLSEGAEHTLEALRQHIAPIKEEKKKIRK